MSTTLPTFADIEAARGRIASEVIRTPAVEAPRLAAQLNLAGLWLKLENQQFTGSFKDRGALNKLKSLSAAEAKQGVIAMSAGNHAQGVAYHAQRLGIPATIVMPEGTPFTKAERTSALGAKVVLKGDTIDAAALHAREIAKAENLTFVHPYDDALIVAGQGTIGLELLEQAPEIDVLVAPIGGGGLIGGIATAMKAKRPEIEIYGAECRLYPSMHHAVNHLPPQNGGQTLADGIAVKSPGVLTRAIVEQHVKEVLLVEEEAIEAAVNLLVEVQRLVTEGAGATALAAILAHPDKFRGKRVAAIVSGGNIDSRLLAQVLMRGLFRDGRVVTLRIEISDQPGVLATVAKLIGSTGGNIIEVHHQRMFFDLPAKRAEIDVVIETRNAQHVHQIIAALEEAGFETRRLSSRSDDTGS
jgi:threonine dehydratase